MIIGELLLIAFIIFLLFFAGRYIRRLSIAPVLYNLKERKRGAQLRALNLYRTEHGLKPLEAYYPLDRLARSHSQRMADRGSCLHNDPDGWAKQIKTAARTDYVGENCFRYPLKRGEKANGHRHRLAEIAPEQG